MNIIKLIKLEIPIYIIAYSLYTEKDISYNGKSLYEIFEIGLGFNLIEEIKRTFLLEDLQELLKEFSLFKENDNYRYMHKQISKQIDKCKEIRETWNY